MILRLIFCYPGPFPDPAVRNDLDQKHQGWHPLCGRDRSFESFLAVGTGPLSPFCGGHRPSFFVVFRSSASVPRQRLLVDPLVFYFVDCRSIEILAISVPSVFMFSLRVMFLRRVSSRTACSFWFISRDNSNVMPESVTLDP